MSDIFSFEFIKVCIKAFNEKFGTKISEEYAAMFFIIVVAFLIVIFKFIVIPYFRNRKWRKKQLNEILKGYRHYTSKWERWLYINTWLQENPPNEHDESSQALSHKSNKHTNAIRLFIKKVLRENNDHSPYYCILGGSGMGKSTFVVNLIWKYINKYNEKNLPYPIRFINCGDTIQLIDNIKDIDNKGNTILILDALDENNEAIDNYNEFLKQLLDSIIYFRIVIITCRTQFFEKYEDELNVISEQTHDPLTKQPKHFRKYYVSPLNSYEVSNYLRKKYLLKFNIRAYKKANNIVKKCNILMARPLLLSYIDDLLNSNIEEFDYSIARIYEIIINKWLELEANFVTTKPDENEEYKKNLLDFSVEIALCLAKKISGKSSIQHEVQDIIKKTAYEKLIQEGYLKGRSLLTRNTNNDYKFAHKSFMEYLVARQMFEKNRTIELESIDCLSNDMIPHFLSSMIKCHYIEDQYKVLSFQGFNNINFVRVTLENTFSFSRKVITINQDSGLLICKSRPENDFLIDIQVSCDVSESITKYLSAFFCIFDNFEKSCYTNIGMIINCNFDFQLIKEAIERINTPSTNKKRIINFTFWDYNLCADKIFDLFKPLIFANSSFVVEKITLIIVKPCDKQKVADDFFEMILSYAKKVKAVSSVALGSIVFTFKYKYDKCEYKVYNDGIEGWYKREFF